MIRIDQTVAGDFSVTTDSSGRIVEGNDLVTALAISFFTRKSHPATKGPNGWWGNKYIRRPIGSYLHLILNDKLTLNNLSRARYFLLDASEWTIERKIFTRRTIATSECTLGGMRIEFVGKQADGGQWSHLWKGVSLDDL